MQSISFREVGPMGADIYDVRFAHGAQRWTIAMDADGKVALAFFQPN
jgi:hypothetical protein